MYPRITHIALHVEDLDACVAFYRDYCAMSVVHERSSGRKRIAWLAESGRETDFVFVMMSGGRTLELPAQDYRHFGFALESRAAVDAVAERARQDGCLIWEPRDEPYPVGYYCGLRDPGGNQVEFSYGQPLGPGAQGVMPGPASEAR
ncbi:VOC family protein [Exilibacterium tricleocarpae]|uniref:VOC family protein n=1 Tax=Exilibacterium tricleocarpae TaxID=2591008 RepID=A0A545TSC7_9GAMM|nr:VOC family protein [Exilibacterium tricleocarpae]TQV80128.1 VOC family protein [Exilibacterium tricleocarpae]